MRRFLTLLILPFLFFNNVSFAEKKEGVSSNIEKNDFKISTSDKLKIGSSGFLELISKPFKYLARGCGAVSGGCYLLLFSFDQYHPPLILKLHNFEEVKVLLGPPTVIGGVGLGAYGLECTLDYLSKKAMPCKELPKNVIFTDKPEDQNITTDENKQRLDAVAQSQEKQNVN